MAGVKIGGGSGLSFTATLDIDDVKKKDAELKKLLADLSVTTNGITKGLTAEKISSDAVAASIKQTRLETLEATKARALDNAQIVKNRLAEQERTIATKAQLAAEKELAAQHTIPTSTGFPTPQTSEFANSSPIPGGAISANDALIREFNADLAAGKITAEEYNAAINQISISQARFAETTVASAVAAKETTLSQKELALQAARDKLALAENTAAIKLQAKEMNAAKGSLDQRRAALIRLQNVFDGLNVAERNSAYGQRLKGVVIDLGDQVKTLEAETLRSQRNVGNYGNAFTKAASGAWGALRKVAQILPGIGIAGLLAFAVEPLMNWISALTKGKDTLEALTEVQRNADKDAAPALVNLKLLYDRATDVKLSMDKRIEAAQQLRESNASEFASSTNLAIVNGKLKESYNDLTKSILENARSQAATAKITDLTSKNLDAQFEIDKNNFDKAQRINSLKQLSSDQISAQNRSGGGAVSIKDQTQSIINQTNFANKSSAELIAKNNKVINFLTGYVKDVGDKTKQVADANKLLGSNLNNFDTLIANEGSKKDLENIKSALQTKLDALAPGDKQIATIRQRLQKVDDLLKFYDVKATSTRQDPAIRLLESQKTTLEQIDALKAKYAAKDETRNDEAQAQIMADFKKQADAIDKQNARYQQYLKSGHTVAQAQAKGLFYIDPNTLKQSETNALAGLAGRQAVDVLKLQVDQQKEIYRQFEEYKLKAGVKAADELYGTQIGNFKNYVDYLKSLEPTVAELNSPKSDVKAKASATKDFLIKEQADANTASLVASKKHLGDLLMQNEDYEQKRATIIANGNEDIAALQKVGDMAGANQAKIAMQNELDSIADQQLKQLSAYKDLYYNIDVLSTEAANKQIAKLKAFALISVVTGKISVQQFNEITKDVNRFQSAVDSKLPDQLKDIGSSLSNWGSEISSFNEGLGKALETSGKLVSAVGEVKANINTINSSSSSTSQKIGAGLGIFSTVLGVVTTIVGLFDHSKETAEKLQYSNELQIKSVDAINKALERQLALTKEIYGPERITAYLKSLADIKAAEASDKAQLNGLLSFTGDKTTDAAIATLNSGGKLTASQTLLIGEAKKRADELGKSLSLAGTSLEDLQRLMDEGKLDDKTSAIVSALVDLQQQAIDTQNALNEEFTGTSFDNLESGIIDLLNNTTAAASDWQDNFIGIIRAGVEKGFETEFLEKPIQEFYTRLADLTKSDGGILSKDSIAKLQDEYNTIIKNAQAQAAQIQVATGISLSTDNSSSSSSTTTATGQIKAITEDTAGVLAGTLQGIQLSAIQTNTLLKPIGINIGQMYNILQSSFAEHVKTSANTLRTANNTDVLADVKASLQSIDKKMSSGSNSLAANGR